MGSGLRGRSEAFPQLDRCASALSVVVSNQCADYSDDDEDDDDEPDAAKDAAAGSVFVLHPDQLGSGTTSV